MTLEICAMELPDGSAVVCEWDKHDGFFVRHVCDGQCFEQRRYYQDKCAALRGFARMACKLFTEQSAEQVSAADVSITRSMASGAIECATVHGGVRVHRKYVGFDEQSALADFLAWVNGGAQ